MLLCRLNPQTFVTNSSFIPSVNMSLYSSMYLPLHAGADFNDTQPFEITIPAQTTAAGGGIHITDDEINEGAQEFVVVLEVASVTTNPVDFSGPTQIQTTVCRIPASDRKCHFKCSTYISLQKCKYWSYITCQICKCQESSVHCMMQGQQNHRAYGGCSFLKSRHKHCLHM